MKIVKLNRDLCRLIIKAIRSAKINNLSIAGQQALFSSLKDTNKRYKKL